MQELALIKGAGKAPVAEAATSPEVDPF